MTCAATRSRLMRRVAGEKLFPSERVLIYYAWDFALCDCPSTHSHVGVPCITVAVRSSGIKGRDVVRCLGCGMVWLSRLQRRADRTLAGAMR